MWPLLLIGAGVFGLSLISQGVGASRLMINQASYGFDLKSLELLVNMQFTNPGNQEFKINYIFLDIMQGATLLGQIRQQDLESTYIILPNSNRQYIIRVKPNLQNFALQAYKSLLLGTKAKKKLPDLTITGNIKVNNIKIPYNQTVSYS